MYCLPSRIYKRLVVLFSYQQASSVPELLPMNNYHGANRILAS